MVYAGHQTGSEVGRAPEGRRDQEAHTRRRRPTRDHRVEMAPKTPGAEESGNYSVAAVSRVSRRGGRPSPSGFSSLISLQRRKFRATLHKAFEIHRIV